MGEPKRLRLSQAQTFLRRNVPLAGTVSAADQSLGSVLAGRLTRIPSLSCTEHNSDKGAVLFQRFS